MATYPPAPELGPNRLAVVSVVLGVIGLFTSLIFIGIGFGIAAVSASTTRRCTRPRWPFLRR